MGSHFMRYQLDIGADPVTVRRALTTESGVNGWWTDRAEVPESVGESLELSFPEVPQPFELELVESTPERIVWRAGAFPPWWQGTTVQWELADNPDGDGTRVVMTHAGFEPDNPTVGIVTMGWGEMLARLRGFAEQGRAQPYFSH